MLQEQDQSQNSDKVFKEVKGEIFIGGEKIRPELRDILREQAKYLSTSQIYEVFNSTIKNEAFDLALNKSKDWDHVLYAKALAYWVDVMTSMVNKLKT